MLLLRFYLCLAFFWLTYLLPGQDSTASFVDETVNAGFPLFGDSQGIAVGDYDNDGFEDIYVSVYSGKNRLCRNLGNGTFQEVAADLGLDIAQKTKTAIWGDLDNDGFLDLYVANLNAEDILFHNLGNGLFEEITTQAGIYNVENPTSVNMTDINNDGFLDIYVSNFGTENRLYLNQRDLTFTDEIYSSGTSDTGSSMGSIFFDFDLDGDQDLYLVHDNIEPNYLHRNDGTGKFTEVSTVSGTDTKGYGMGVDVGDINNDGYPDLYITNLFKNVLLLNQGDGTFSDISAHANVDDFGMGWGTSFLDYDSDGLQDIYVSNDSYFSDYSNVLYQNNGDSTFQKVEIDEAISNTKASYGVACLDFELNGTVDMVLANNGAEDYTQLFKNTYATTNWIGLKLIGTQSNRGAIGAKIRIRDEMGRMHYKELTAGHGWASQNSSILHFGLGDVETIQAITVFWPSGLEQQLEALEIGQYYTLIEGKQAVTGILSSSTITTAAFDQPIPDELDLEVFPNPNTGQFIMKITKTQTDPLHLSLYDAMGRLLKEEFVEQARTGEVSINLNLENQKQTISSGVIIARIKCGGSLISQKIIISAL